MNVPKTYTYKGYTITLNLTGWYSCHTSRYGILKADTLNGIKKLINHAANAPQHYH